ncbi:MAG: sulfatase-like hydrolase/transferase [Deltaproteobacteria bacterium]|nr:sulfatase-like hydrolase/transferase [Deltaproteobacteria bacterium]
MEAANWSRPGIMTLFTGKQVPELRLPTQPSRRKLHETVRAMFEADGPETAPVLFRGAGYRTIAVVNNIFVLPGERISVDLGFDALTQTMRADLSTMDVEQFTARTLERHRDEQVFLYIHQNAPNPADVPPRRFRRAAKPAWKNREEYGQWRYLASLALADFTFGRFQEMLSAVGWGKTATVAFTADHGQVNELAHEIRTPDGPGRLRRAQYFHGQTLYDEELHVPLLVRGPGIAPETRVTGQRSSTNFLSTLLTLADITPPATIAYGEFAADLLGRGTTSEDEVAVSHGKSCASVRFANLYKYIRWEEPRRLTRVGREWRLDAVREELFDLTQDPLETKNLINDDPDTALRMRRIYEQEVKTFERVVALTVPAGKADQIRIVGAAEAAAIPGGLLKPDADAVIGLTMSEETRVAIFPDEFAETLRVEIFLKGEMLSRDKLRFGPAFRMPPGDGGYVLSARRSKMRNPSTSSRPTLTAPRAPTSPS